MIGGIPCEQRGRADGGEEVGGCRCRDRDRLRMRDDDCDREDEEYDERQRLLCCGEMRGEVGDGRGHETIAKEAKSLLSPSPSKNHIALTWIVVYI